MDNIEDIRRFTLRTAGTGEPPPLKHGPSPYLVEGILSEGQYVVVFDSDPAPSAPPASGYRARPAAVRIDAEEMKILFVLVSKEERQRGTDRWPVQVKRGANGTLAMTHVAGTHATRLIVDPWYA